MRLDIFREPDTGFKAFQHTKRLGRLIKHLTVLNAVDTEMRQIVILRKIAYQIRMTVLRDHLIGIDSILPFFAAAVESEFQLSVKSAVTVMEGYLSAVCYGAADIFKRHQDFPVQNLSVNIHVDLGYFRTEIFARQSFKTVDQTQTVFFRESVCQQNAVNQQTQLAVHKLVNVIPVGQYCFFAVFAVSDNSIFFKVAATVFDRKSEFHQLGKVSPDCFTINFHSVFRFHQVLYLLLRKPVVFVSVFPQYIQNIKYNHFLGLHIGHDYPPHMYYNYIHYTPLWKKKQAF